MYVDICELFLRYFTTRLYKIWRFHCECAFISEETIPRKPGATQITMSILLDLLQFTEIDWGLLRLQYKTSGGHNLCIPVFCFCLAKIGSGNLLLIFPHHRMDHKNSSMHRIVQFFCKL